MANQEDIERAKLGKEVWNKWAEDNPGAATDFSNEKLESIGFSGFIFPGNVTFENSEISQADFRHATFSGDAWFTEVTFSGACRVL